MATTLKLINCFDDVDMEQFFETGRNRPTRGHERKVSKNKQGEI